MTLSKMTLQKFINDLELIRTLTVNTLKTKYKRSKLGFSWSMLNPIFNIVVISLVFSTIMGMTYSQFAVFFFSGFLAWSLYANSLTSSSNCLISNENLIKKTPINLLIFPLVSVCVNMVEFGLALLTLTIVFVFLGVKFTLAIFFLPISFVLLVFFTIGICLITSILTAFFRDFAHIIIVLVQLWFYLTPVLYPKTFLIGKKQILSYINPMVTYVDLFREPLAYGHFPSLNEIGVAFVLSFSLFTIGFIIFNRYKHQVIFKL